MPLLLITVPFNEMLPVPDVVIATTEFKAAVTVSPVRVPTDVKLDVKIPDPRVFNDK